MDERQVDWEAYVRSKVEVRNEQGGRGYDLGVRVFDCPLCDDERSRGWVNVERQSAGCWNGGCVADQGLKGGAVEWARVLEGFHTRGRTVAYLRESFPSIGIIQRPPPLPVSRYEDWCTLPSEFQPISRNKGEWVYRMAVGFAQRQWGIGVEDLITAGVGYCVGGRYATRVIFPIVMGGQLVGFQARAVVKGLQPKYLTSTVGKSGTPGAECGRPAEAMVYGVDAIRAGDTVGVVEGIGDVLALRYRRQTAAALLGDDLTAEKLAVIADRKPGLVVVALDNEPGLLSRSWAIASAFRSWGVPSTAARWEGGKDAGARAKAITMEASLSSQIRSRLTTRRPG